MRGSHRLLGIIAGVCTGGVCAAQEELRLPSTDVHYKRVRDYVEDTPVPGYRHAPDEALEAFRDMKFAIRIHWGLYSVWGEGHESWPFLKFDNDKRQRYQDLSKTWNPRGFDADEWMRFFQRSGVRMFAFTTKHHEGFSLFDTRTRVVRRIDWTAPGGPAIVPCDEAYSVMESPFKRDVVKELCDAARRYDIRTTLYYSHPDWHDADFRPYCYHPASTPASKADLARFGTDNRAKGFEAPDLTPEEKARMVARHRAQLKELLTNYGKIDAVCLDMWMGPDVWPELRETMLELRALAPNTMFRARGIGNYGDYYTPEGFVPGAKENTSMPWMCIYPLGKSFSYMTNDVFKGSAWLITNLVDTVAKGGNFMPAIGPDADGRFDPEAVREFEEAGAWLKVNGEAIYATRPRTGGLWREGANVRFTRSKDGKTVYALCLAWPGQTLSLDSIKPAADAAVTLVGTTGPLPWQRKAGADEGLVIRIPETYQDSANRPCKTAWAFRISPVIQQ